MPTSILTVLGEIIGSFWDMSWDFMSVIEKYIFIKAMSTSSLFRSERRSSVGYVRTSHEITDLKYSWNLEPCFLSGSHEVGFDYVVRFT